jgi:hypothetical protein
MGNSLSLSVQSDHALDPIINITSHVYGALSTAGIPSTISSVVLENMEQSAAPTLEVLSSSNHGNKYTTVRVTTQASSASNPSRLFDSEIQAIRPSLEQQQPKDIDTPTLRIQPRAENFLYEESMVDSYEAPAKDRVAVEQQQYVPPSVNQPSGSSSIINHPIARHTDIAPHEGHPTTKVLKEKTHTRGNPTIPIKTPTTVRIAHKPIQLFGRRHLNHIAELMSRELELDD